MEVTCTVDFGGLEEKLKELGPKLARKAFRKAGRKVGKFWVDEVKSRVPVNTGDLKDSIAAKVTTKAYSDHGEVKVSVGPTYQKTNRKNGDGSQQPGVYGMFVEFGTVHSRAQPFMRPTFDETADQVVEIFADSLKEDLETIIKR